MVLETILIILAFIMVLSGIYSVLFPPLPGIWMAWLGVFIFALADNFSAVSGRAVMVFLFLTLLVSILEFLIPLVGAKRYKASKNGLVGSFAGSFIGLFILGPLGAILGMFVGLVAGEILNGKDLEEISGSLRGALLGFFVSSLIKLGLAAAMLAYLLVAVFKLL